MHNPPLQRRLVWSKPLRICHWSLALATLTLLLTGWLVRWAPERAEQVRDYHFIAAALLIAALLARVWLLFAGKGTARIDQLLPDRHRLGQAWQVLRSYLTLGKIPLPKWYAHNPLWAPLYLLLFLVLTLQAGTGLALLNDITLLGGVSLRGLHGWGFGFLLVFTLLHLVASFFHDAKGGGDDVSAMINGQRLFTIEPLEVEPGSGTVIPLKEVRLKKP